MGAIADVDDALKVLERREPAWLVADALHWLAREGYKEHSSLVASYLADCNDEFLVEEAAAALMRLGAQEGASTLCDRLKHSPPSLAIAILVRVVWLLDAPDAHQTNVARIAECADAVMRERFDEFLEANPERTRELALQLSTL